jgi:hydroxypyruvate reductase
LIKKPLKLPLDRNSRNILTILNEGFNSSTLYEQEFKKYLLKNKIQLPKSKINLKKYDRVFLVAVGKSAGKMSEYVSKKINFQNGIVIVPTGVEPKLKKSIFKIFHGGHPLPNYNSYNSGKKLVSFLNETTKNDFVVFLMSGGGSALSVNPDSISLKDMIVVNYVLSRSGANISEIACIRKHLSLIKGGRLIQKMNCNGISFLISDVIGDDLGSISSGMTYCDKSTFGDALRIVKKFSLENKLPKSALSILKSGSNGERPETPKKPKIKNIILLNNSTCLFKMRIKSKKLGYNSHVLNKIDGDVLGVANVLSNMALKLKNNCLIFGGEPTVHVTGNGKGGRNQELVLRLYEKLKNQKFNFTIASIGTDGIDGNTKFAGALFSTEYEYDGEPYLKNNDSSSFFKKYGGLIKTGITQNNVNDIGVILRHN